MSSQELITEHLDLWTGAVTKKSSSGRGTNGKVELTGVKKLRELILELAVRGKLVEQNSTDEPASMLLEKIADEKAQLAKEGKIKKSKMLPEVDEEEKPFDLPDGWQWARMEAISEYIQRGKGPKYADSGKVRVVSQKCIQWSRFDLKSARFVDDNSLSGYQDERYIRENDILWNSTGTGTVGRAIVVKRQQCSIVADSHVTIIRPLVSEPRHILNYILSPSVQQRIEPDHENSLVSGTTKQVELNSTSVKMLAVPLPPLNEQHRIVQKVDELMALCDRLEQQTSDQLEAHETLVDTLLGTLTQSENTTELADNWARIKDHFDTLFTTEQSIGKLKQTILQLAVMGRLVEQDAGDEPAYELLKRIAEEKVRLVAVRKLKKQKPLAEIVEEEKPFELPSGWHWARFGDVCSIKGELVRPENFPDLRQVAPDCIEKGTGLITENRTVKESGVKGPNSRFFAGQIVYSKIRPSLSKAALVDFDGLCSADMYPIDAFIDARFLLTEILSEVFLQQVRIAENRIKMPKLNQESLTGFVLPIPPLAEQHRIVQKVDELMALCDQLQERLNQASDTRYQLAGAVVEGALN
ncbi:restriction endonuclease subunit S [Halomonas vilamensis]|uniref:Restriction endonuclease subunit S n=1 Tax=Vreelandella vilamensis TaxID=531309 RepID=A0ABU1H5Q2_9GAMM|nr:restriction endonuclease subunit S [Halomonas vilamensis]MDR5899628.1 restriction endonuclease subunit S [Halomonas vilamensis]